MEKQIVSKYHQSKEDLEREESIILSSIENPQRFEELYIKYHEQIYRFIYQRISDKVTTDELTSEVFYKALSSLKKYKFKGVPFSSWLYRIAHNLLVDYFKKSKKERVVNLETDFIINLSEETYEENLIDYDAKLAQAIAQLKAEDFQLIEMRFFHQMSFKEIGDIVEITENNAKVRTYRVLDNLKKIILKRSK